MAFKNPKEQAQALLEQPLTPQTYDEFKAQLGHHPTDEEYRGWIKPRIASRVGEYKKQGLDEKQALAELDDEFGYEDLVREAYYGRPKRTDVQVWRDRGKNLIADAFKDLSDQQIQDFINTFGFDRKGEW